MFFAIFPTIFFAVYSLIKRRTNFHIWFSFLCFLVVVYAFGYLMELNLDTLEGMIFWNRFQYLSLPFFLAAWLCFVIEYFTKRTKKSRVVKVVIFLVPAVTFFARLTNGLHNLFYTRIGVFDTGYFTNLELGRGPFYIIHSVFVSFCAIISLFIIIAKRKKIPGDYKRILAALLFVIAIPYGGFLMTVFEFANISLDYSALTLPITTTLFFAIMFKNDILSLVPCNI